MMTEQTILTLDDVAELNPMCISTVQRTKTFYFRPVDGWKRGESEEVRKTEERIMTEMQNSIGCFPIVQLVRSPDRYFEFRFESTVVNDNQSSSQDFTSELRACIGFLMAVTKKENLTLVTVGV